MTSPRAGSRLNGPLKFAATIAGLALLLWMNYYLRHTLESADQYLYSFYKYFYKAEEAVIFSPATPWWKLLLPIPMFTGVWNSSTLVLARLLEEYFAPTTEWYLFNAVLIVASFWTSWVAFRSRVFSYTLAICMGFGTQLYVTYPNSGTISFPLLFVYYECLLLAIYKVLTADARRLGWWAFFAVSLAFTVVAYEPWLDLLVAFWVTSVFLYVVLGRMGLGLVRRRLVTVTAILTVVGIAHVITKISLGYGQSHGMEADIIVNYPFTSPKVEDFLSNVFTNFYMAATNFLPPSLVSSTALYEIGGEKLIEFQHGYHAPFNYLVPMHYVFSWRYYAGMLAALYTVGLFVLIRDCWRRPSAERVVLIVFMLILWVGGSGPTHSFIKFRPMNSMPVQTYHVMAGVFGCSLVISLLAMRAWTRWPRPAGGLTVALVWSVIFYSALARPGMISHQAAQSGLGVGAYPNPMAVLMAKLGRPYEQPGGLALYQLMKFSSAATAAPSSTAAAPEIRRFEGGLLPLPLQAPVLSEWGHPPAVTVVMNGQTATVQGDNTQMGYQLTSPPLPVAPGSRVLVRVSGTIEQGQVCLGALDGTQAKWLVPADSTKQEILVETGDNTHFTIVFANCMPAFGTTTSRFTLQSVSYAVVGTGGAKP